MMMMGYKSSRFLRNNLYIWDYLGKCVHNNLYIWDYLGKCVRTRALSQYLYQACTKPTVWLGSG